MEESFAYDEDEDDANNIVSSYFKRNVSEKIRDRIYDNAKFELDKVIKDRNLENKIEIIKESINKSKKNISENIKIRADESLEVHCVAVCINKDSDKVLMFKRSDEEGLRFGEKWDFGCAKVVRGWTFKEALEKEYKNFANLDIDIKEPFKDYDFEDKDTGVIIPGIRYKAIVKNESEIDLNLKKYVDYKWVDLELINEMEKNKSDESPFIDYNEFKQIVEIVL